MRGLVVQDAVPTPRRYSGHGSFGCTHYLDTELRGLPATAVSASSGCGNPVATARPEPGESIVDLGAGGGLDALLAGRAVGANGVVYAVDANPLMVDTAQRSARHAGMDNVIAVQSTMERLPLPDACADKVVSNNAINLSADKAAVLREASRVLKPGGTVTVTDLLGDISDSCHARPNYAGQAGCEHAAISAFRYELLLSAAGFKNIAITSQRTVTDSLRIAEITAVKPG